LYTWESGRMPIVNRRRFSMDITAEVGPQLHAPEVLVSLYINPVGRSGQRGFLSRLLVPPRSNGAVTA
jgi:hypothetical protein